MAIFHLIIEAIDKTHIDFFMEGNGNNKWRALFGQLANGLPSEIQGWAWYYGLEDHEHGLTH
jgi:hypothetical protein